MLYIHIKMDKSKNNSTNSNSSDTYSSNTNSSDDSNEIEWNGEVINNRYLILNKLGQGSYCSVWSTYDIETRKLIALKIYNIDDTEDGLHEKNVLDELKKIKLPYSILYDKMIEFEFDEDDYIAFTMENCGYSLNEIRKIFKDIIRTDTHINLKYMIFINKIKNDMLNILNILHNNGYAHTDIKPENILINIPKLESKILYEQIYGLHDKLKKNKSKKILIELCELVKTHKNITINNTDIINYISTFDYDIRLCDYGTCLKFGDNTIYKKHTSYYKSPNIIMRYPLTSKYDYWSFACTLYELITGTVLFNPFDENLIELYDDVEDINLMYLITSTIGMPPIELINKSKVSDVLFTSDRKSIRGYKYMKYNDIISPLYELEIEINKNILQELILFILQFLIY